jgi:hypothetical protein
MFEIAFENYYLQIELFYNSNNVSKPMLANEVSTQKRILLAHIYWVLFMIKYGASPSTDMWIKTTGYYSPIKKNEILSLVAKWLGGHLVK